MSCKILLTGGSGQLGQELLRQQWPPGWQLIAPARSGLDLQDGEALTAEATGGGYAAVINAGAFTNVDGAEAEPLSAWRINALAPAALAWACCGAGIPIVQISTDYVFDGTRGDAWRPDDKIAPLSVYGASKAAGELAVRTSGARHAILRTAWVVSPQGRNFVRTMLRLAKERDALHVVDDQRGSPTSAQDLAFAVRVVTERQIADPAFRSGTWHVANGGAASWYDVAVHVMDAAAQAGRAVPPVHRTTSADLAAAAQRPANSCLDTTTLEADFGVRLRPWQQAVLAVVNDIMESETE